MSYEEEDTCHMSYALSRLPHMRRRIHVIRGGGYMSYVLRAFPPPTYEEEDTCHMRRRIHVICPTRFP